MKCMFITPKYSVVTNDTETRHKPDLEQFYSSLIKYKIISYIFIYNSEDQSTLSSHTWV